MIIHIIWYIIYFNIFILCVDATFLPIFNVHLFIMGFLVSTTYFLLLHCHPSDEPDEPTEGSEQSSSESEESEESFEDVLAGELEACICLQLDGRNFCGFSFPPPLFFIFVCLIIRFVISTLVPIFFIEISFILPPPPQQDEGEWRPWTSTLTSTRSLELSPCLTSPFQRTLCKPGPRRILYLGFHINTIINAR